MTYFLRSGNCFLFKEGGTELNSIQIALLGVVGTLLALQFKSGKSEYGIYVSLAVSLFLFLCMLSRLEIFVQTVKKTGCRTDEYFVENGRCDLCG